MTDLELPKAGIRTLRLTIERLDLAMGDYFVNVGLYQQNWEFCYDRHNQVYPLAVVGVSGGKGILNPPLRWKVLLPCKDGEVAAGSTEYLSAGAGRG